MLSAADGDLNITGATAANALETLTLNASSDSELDDIDLTNANTTKLVMTGAGDLTITGISNAAKLNTYDASAATGDVAVTGVNATGNTVTGGTGDDTLAGASGNDVITGGAGDDQITGGAGNDNLDGGAGNDTVILSSVTKDDVAKGGDGVDTLSLATGVTYSATENAGVGISGFEVLASTGTVSQNMKGLAGNTITTAALGAGATSLTVQESAITNVVGAVSGAVNIGLATDGTADALSISLGTVSTATSASVTLDAVDIEDLTVTSQGADGNTLTLDDDTAGTLTVASASVADTDLKSITILGDKNLVINDSGDDSALASIDASGFTGNTLQVVATSSEVAMTVDASGAYSADIDTGDGADTITVGDGGTANANTVNGGDGADTIVAGAGNDTLNAGDDGGSVTAGAGDDTVSSGDGADTIVLGDGDDRVTDSGAGADVITGGAGNDTVVTAGAGADSIDGGAGNDNLSGGADNDTILGGAGNDTLNGDAGNDSIVGGDGNDTITDGAGNDVVTGGDGVDTITISTGNDNIDAGAGNDILSITGLSNADTITGGDGTDSLSITNSSTGTLTPQFTSIESLTVKTSVNFALNQTDATDKTSLKTFTITSTEDTADSVNLTKIASGSTVNISEDLSWDGADAEDTNDTGNIGEVNISTIDGGTLTLNVHADEDALTHADTTFANVTDLTGAATITINSKNSDSNDIQNSLVALGLDNDETQTLVINAEDSAGLVVGNVTNAAALESLTFSTAAGAASTMGTMETATALNSLTLSSTGASSTLNVGAIGGTSAAGLESLAISAGATSSTTTAAITSTGSTALTSATVTVSDANSIAAIGGAINLGTATVASFGITVADNAQLQYASSSITSGAITAGTLSFGNYSTITDIDSNADEDLTVTGAVTTLGVTVGRDITNAAGDSFIFSGKVTTLNLTSTLDNENVAMDANNDLAYDGESLIEFGDIDNVTYTHTGSGSLNWVGSAISADAEDSQVISSNTTSTTSDTITGGAGNDTLTGNAGTNTITGGDGVDVITAGAGADSLDGGAGNDTLNAGSGADSVDAGAGSDAIDLTETTQAADVVQLASDDGESSDSAGVLAAEGETGEATGSDTITGFDGGFDTILITSTVGEYNHGEDISVGDGTGLDSGEAAEAGEAGYYATNQLLFNMDDAEDTFDNSGDIVLNFSDFDLNGVAQLDAENDLAVSDVSSLIQYALTGSGEADTIVTGALADTVSGLAGADTINGGAGNDSITGGTGADALTGGEGDDTFTYALDDSTEAAPDAIADLAIASDVIDLTATVLVTDVEDVEGGTEHGGEAGDVDANVDNGVMTLAVGEGEAADVTAYNTLAEFMDIAELAVEAGLGAEGEDVASAALAFAVGEDTYVTQWSYDHGTTSATVENVIKITGVSSITALGTTAAAGTIVLG